MNLRSKKYAKKGAQSAPTAKPLTKFAALTLMLREDGLIGDVTCWRGPFAICYLLRSRCISVKRVMLTMPRKWRKKNMLLTLLLMT